MPADKQARAGVGAKAAISKAVTPIDRYVGRRLQEGRRLAGLSQQQLASRLGVTFQQIQKYENGRNRISASRLHHAAQLFGVSILWFFESWANEEHTPSSKLGTTSTAPDNRETERFIEVVCRIANPQRRRRLRQIMAVLANKNPSE